MVMTRRSDPRHNKAVEMQEDTAVDPSPEYADDAWLRRISMAGICLPILFIVTMSVLRPHLLEVLWPGHAHVLFDMCVLTAAVIFGVAMITAIRRGHGLLLARNRELDEANRALDDIGRQRSALIADLDRTNRRGAAVCDVLLRVARQEDPCTTLTLIARHARELLDADDSGICLTPHPLPSSPAPDGAALVGSVSVPICGPRGELGHLWVRGVRSPDPETCSTLSDLAAIALDQASLLDKTRHAATLAERDRIAREMHDSLAQVLGATHLRLQTLTTYPSIQENALLQEEVSALAELCHDAYGDVREAILGLRESPRDGTGLLESLRSYVAKYSRQARVSTVFHSTLAGELTLPPHCEVQVIRIVQEALTNVRKHSGSSSAVVRVSQDGDMVLFEVEDDGRGFDPAGLTRQGQGFGLLSMRERSELAGGVLTVDSIPGRGTRIAVSVPHRRSSAGLIQAVHA